MFKLEILRKKVLQQSLHKSPMLSKIRRQIGLSANNLPTKYSLSPNQSKCYVTKLVGVTNKKMRCNYSIIGDQNGKTNAGCHLLPRGREEGETKHLKDQTKCLVSGDFFNTFHLNSRFLQTQHINHKLEIHFASTTRLTRICVLNPKIISLP